MPERIKEVFDLDKNGEKGKCRYNKLCSFGYSTEELAAAERIQLSADASYVQDEELIARVIEDPTSVQFETGLGYTPGAFGDASKWGLSVQRLSLTSPSDIDNFGLEKSRQKGRTYRGFVTSQVGILRSAKSTHDGRRLAAVFSTPLPDTPSHADVYACHPNPAEKEAIKGLFWRAFNLDAIVEQYMQSIADSRPEPLS